MRILFISHSGELGGAERCLLTLLRHIDRAIFEPVVVVPYEGRLSKQLRTLGMEPIILPLPWWFSVERRGDIDLIIGSCYEELPISSLSPSDLLDLGEDACRRRIGELERIISVHNIDIVHSNTVTIVEGAIAARLTGVKHIWHIHEYLDGNPSLIQWLPRIASNWLFRALAGQLVVPSHSLGMSLASKVGHDNVLYIANGVESIWEHQTDLDRMGAQLRRHYLREFNLEPSEYLLSSVGSVLPEKGWCDIIDTANSLLRTGCDVTFLVVGDCARASNYFQTLLQKVRDYGLESRVIFTGRRDDAQSVMLASDVVFQPSRKESFSLVCAEAMALGKPVVGTRCGGMEEIIDHNQTGLLTEPGDYAAMAAAIKYLLDDPSVRRQQGQRGRKKYLEEYAPSKYAQRFMDLYVRMTGGCLAKPERYQHSEGADFESFVSLYSAVLSFGATAAMHLGKLEATQAQLKAVRQSRSYRWTALFRRMRRALTRFMMLVVTI